MTVSKRVCGPADLVHISKLFIHPVHAYRVLVQDVVVVAHCLVVLDPAAVGNVQLTILEQFLHILSFCLVQVLVPVLEKDDL